MPTLLHPPVVVITGASSGNGRATAHALARQGARLVLAARRGEELAAAVSECEALGGAAIAVPTDVGDHAAIQELARRAVEAFGRIDVWVNCAGVLAFGRVDETPHEVIEQVLRTNVLGCFNCAQAAAAQFRRQGSGHLVNVASVLAHTAQPFASAYVASKAAIVALSDSLRQELAGERNIHVTTVLPFAIDTPIYQRAANYTGRQVGPINPHYPAQTVADAIVAAIRRPRRTVYAGGLGPLASLQKALAPTLSDLVVRGAVQALEFRPGTAGASSGNVLAPISDGWAVSGGWTSGTIRTGRLLAGAVAAAGLLALTLAGSALLGKRRR